MWNDVDQTTATAMRQCWVCSQPPIQEVQPCFWATGTKMIPGAKWTSQTWGKRHWRGVCCCKWDLQSSTAFPSRGSTASQGSGRDIFRWTCFFFFFNGKFYYLALTQTQRLGVKFCNQLHFKSSMHIPPSNDETLPFEEPEWWFLWVWILMHFTWRYLPREIKMHNRWIL